MLGIRNGGVSHNRVFDLFSDLLAAYRVGCELTYQIVLQFSLLRVALNWLFSSFGGNPLLFLSGRCQIYKTLWLGLRSNSITKYRSTFFGASIFHGSALVG